MAVILGSRLHMLLCIKLVDMYALKAAIKLGTDKMALPEQYGDITSSNTVCVQLLVC